MSEGEILNEISNKSTVQGWIALCYAGLLDEPSIDWPRINAAIRARWKGRTALTRIKEQAWRNRERGMSA
jgi:hypothetical protein